MIEFLKSKTQRGDAMHSDSTHLSEEPPDDAHLLLGHQRPKFPSSGAIRGIPQPNTPTPLPVNVFALQVSPENGRATPDGELTAQSLLDHWCNSISASSLMDESGVATGLPWNMMLGADDQTGWLAQNSLSMVSLQLWTSVVVRGSLKEGRRPARQLEMSGSRGPSFNHGGTSRSKQFFVPVDGTPRSPGLDRFGRGWWGPSRFCNERASEPTRNGQILARNMNTDHLRLQHRMRAPYTLLTLLTCTIITACHHGLSPIPMRPNPHCSSAPGSNLISYLYESPFRRGAAL